MAATFKHLRNLVQTTVLLALIAIPTSTSSGAVGTQRASLVKRPVREPMCEILEYGLYVPTTAPVRFPDPTSVTGERFEIEDVKFLRQTKVVPLELHAGFGIRYRLHLPANKSSNITWRISFPRPGIRGNSGWEHGTVATGELTQHLLYNFTNAWEMLAGPWKFQVSVDNQIACTFSFQVK